MTLRNNGYTHTHYNWEFGRLISFHGCLNDNKNVIMPAVVNISRCNFAEGKKILPIVQFIISIDKNTPTFVNNTVNYYLVKKLASQTHRCILINLSFT